MTTPAKGASWFKMKAAASGTLDVNIYDEIGAWGVSAQEFKRAIDGNENVTEINLSLHSPGGAVFEGLAIYNMLRNHPAKVTIRIDGLAASIASVVAMAGDRVIIADNAFLMVHKPWMATVGDATALRDDAETLDRVEPALLSAYTKKSGLSTDKVAAMLEKETWITGAEAVELGLADELADAARAVAALRVDSIKAFENPPNNIERVCGITPETPVDKALAALEQRRERDECIAMLAREFESMQELVDSGAFANCSTADQVNEVFMSHLGQKATPTAGNYTYVYADNGRIVQDVLTDALQARAGIATLQDKTNPYQQASLLEMAKASLVQNGVGIATMAPIQVVAAAISHTTGDFPSVLKDTAEKAMLRGWDEAPENWPKWCRKGEINSFHPATRAGIGSFPSLPRKIEGAEYKHVTTDDRGETIVLATYGSLFTITREAIINDDLSAFSRIPAAQGRAASRTIGDLAYNVLISNTQLSDGKGIFHADHGGNSIEDELSVEGVGNARRIMRLQKDSGGHPLNISAGYLLVPAALESQAEQVIASTSVAGATNSGVRNPVNSAAEIIVESRLDADSDRNWYLVAGAGDTVEVAFLNGIEAPYLEEQWSFEQDGLAFKTRIDAGVAPMDYRGFVRSVPPEPIE